MKYAEIYKLKIKGGTVKMTHIINYNCHKQCADICMEKYCDNLATEYFPIEISGFTFLIPMCKEHYWKIINSEDNKNGKD